MSVEERLAGSGLGGKTLRDFAKSQGIASDVALQRLEAVHIDAVPGDRIKLIAERAGTRPRFGAGAFCSMLCDQPRNSDSRSG